MMVTKRDICPHCKHLWDVRDFCDVCGQDDNSMTMPYILDCGYGSNFDEKKFHFCSLECLAEWSMKKLDEERIKFPKVVQEERK